MRKEPMPPDMIKRKNYRTKGDALAAMRRFGYSPSPSLLNDMATDEMVGGPMRWAVSTILCDKCRFYWTSIYPASYPVDGFICISCKRPIAKSYAGDRKPRKKK